MNAVRICQLADAACSMGCSEFECRHGRPGRRSVTSEEDAALRRAALKAGKIVDKGRLQPAPPVPQTVQEITRLMNAWASALIELDRCPLGASKDAQREKCQAAFKPLESALTALVEKNHELQFSLDGINAMRRPLTDCLAKNVIEALWNAQRFTIGQMETIKAYLQPSASAATHGIEPEQGEVKS